MIDYVGFRKWLERETNYTERTISNILSRLKRADSLLIWFDEDYYLFKLEQVEEFRKLSSSIKSQMRKAIRLYYNFYLKEKKEHI